MASRRKAKTDDAAARIRHLIALDATNVMRRLAARREEMVALFSRLRDREPMLETVRSWFGSVTVGELATLSVVEQSCVNSFYESLAELRWYLRYTEDMPGTVQKTAGQHQRQLTEAYSRLIAALGPPSADGAPVVDVEVVAREEPPVRPALTSGTRGRT